MYDCIKNNVENYLDFLLLYLFLEAFLKKIEKKKWALYKKNHIEKLIFIWPISYFGCSIFYQG